MRGFSEPGKKEMRIHNLAISIFESILQMNSVNTGVVMRFGKLKYSQLANEQII